MEKIIVVFLMIALLLGPVGYFAWRSFLLGGGLLEEEVRNVVSVENPSGTIEAHVMSYGKLLTDPPAYAVYLVQKGAAVPDRDEAVVTVVGARGINITWSGNVELAVLVEEGKLKSKLKRHSLSVLGTNYFVSVIDCRRSVNEGCHNLKW
jgi:hypothetical protein